MAVLRNAAILLRRAVPLVRRRRSDDDLAEEIGLHLELRTRALIDEGWRPQEAAVDAGRRWVEHFTQDVRFGTSYLLMRAASSLPFGVRPFDPAALLLCAGALVAAGLAPAFWPAHRATRIDPAITFRSL